MKLFAKSAPLVLAALVISISGCETTSHAQEGEIIGGIIGGIAGAQVGEGRGRTAAIIVGTIAGSMIGRHIGETMDSADRAQTANTLTYNRTGESTSWVNPDNGNIYEVTPTRTYESASGPCREFTIDATIGGSADEEVYGTACLQQDGSWKLVQ